MTILSEAKMATLGDKLKAQTTETLIEKVVKAAKKEVKKVSKKKNE